MEPTAALHSIETVLRIAIRRVYEGERWLDAPGAPERERLVHKQTEDTKKRDGVVVSSDLLEYTDIFHLTKIVLKSWEQFKPIFQDKKRTEVYLSLVSEMQLPEVDDEKRMRVYFDVVNDVRNSIAHSRDLVPYEKLLLSGIAQHLSNQLSLYGTSGDATMEYYPTIEKVTDSFGTVGRETSMFRADTRVRLDVGQTLRFEGLAVSARSKPVRWFLYRAVDLGIGSEVWELSDGLTLDYEWTVPESEVGENREYAIVLISTSKYHRHNQSNIGVYGPHDDLRYFTYSINPPADD